VGLRAHMSTYRGTLGLQTGPRWWEPLDQQTGPRCMLTTIRSDISSPSTSNNHLALLGYGSMCVGTLIHIARYHSKTSNNNNNEFLS